jgi:glycosyltransferase involved in cell wall biosynthesis
VAVAHGADVRLLLAVPPPVRAWCLRHIAARATRIRFAASSSLDQLCLALPDDLARQLRDKATVELPPIELPDVTVQAAALRRTVACDRLVVLVARLVASKRVELAIDALQFFSTRVRLHVIGDGPTRASLLARDRLHRVTFAGALPRKRTLAWIAAADVLIHTSAAEAAPTVVREARMLGTPVVACDAGDVARWAAVDPGIVVALPQVPALVDALRLLLR